MQISARVAKRLNPIQDGGGEKGPPYKFCPVASYVFSTYGITLNGANSCSFVNDFARHVVIFGINNSSPSHNDNRKNDFLV